MIHRAMAAPFGCRSCMNATLRVIGLDRCSKVHAASRDVCITAQTSVGDVPHSGLNARERPRYPHMLLIVGLLVTTTILVSALRMRPGSANVHLGRMSERWLAAQRTVRPS